VVSNIQDGCIVYGFAGENSVIEEDGTMIESIESPDAMCAGAQRD
jgi:hypothetical protein